MSTAVSPRFADLAYYNGDSFADAKPCEISVGSSDANPAVQEKTSNDSHLISCDPPKEDKDLDHVNKDSNQQIGQSDSPGRRVETETFHSCGILQNRCMSCLACTASPGEKRKTLVPTSPGTKRKSSFTHKFSFKWRESLESHSLCKCYFFGALINEICLAKLDPLENMAATLDFSFLMKLSYLAYNVGMK